MAFQNWDNDAWYFPGGYVLSGFSRKQGLRQGLSASFPLGTIFQEGRVKGRAQHRQMESSARWVLDLATSEAVSGLTSWDSSNCWRKCIWGLSTRGREGAAVIYWLPPTLVKVPLRHPRRLCTSKCLAGPHRIPCLCVSAASAPAGSGSEPAQKRSHHSHWLAISWGWENLKLCLRGVCYAPGPISGKTSHETRASCKTLWKTNFSVKLLWYVISLTNLL